MGASIRVLVFDDHSLFREGLVALLQKDDDLVVVGEAETSWNAPAMTVETAANIVLLDVEMPGPSVYTTLRATKRESPTTHVVILTMHQDLGLQARLLRAGASAYLTKSLPSSVLISRLRELGSEPAGTTSPGEATPVAGSAGGPLSAREEQVLRLLARALSNAEIAQILSISVGTVKRHTSNLYGKLDASSRMDAVRKAARLGLAGLGWNSDDDSSRA